MEMLEAADLIQLYDHQANTLVQHLKKNKMSDSKLLLLVWKISNVWLPLIFISKRDKIGTKRGILPKKGKEKKDTIFRIITAYQI